MTIFYPIILTPENTGFTVFIPDFNIYTQGSDLTEAIEMARDAIGLMGIDMKDENKKLPSPTPINKIKVDKDDSVYLVEIEIDILSFS